MGFTGRYSRINKTRPQIVIRHQIRRRLEAPVVAVVERGRPVLRSDALRRTLVRPVVRVPMRVEVPAAPALEFRRKIMVSAIRTKRQAFVVRPFVVRRTPDVLLPLEKRRPVMVAGHRKRLPDHKGVQI